MNDMKKDYRLYLVKPEDIAEDEKHYLITATWSLLYTDNEPPKQSREITDISILPGTAIRWLNETVMELRRAYLEENKNEILQFAKSFHEVFEQELQAERRKIEAEGQDERQSDQEAGGV